MSWELLYLLKKWTKCSMTLHVTLQEIFCAIHGSFIIFSLPLTLCYPNDAQRLQTLCSLEPTGTDTA